VSETCHPSRPTRGRCLREDRGGVAVEYALLAALLAMALVGPLTLLGGSILAPQLPELVDALDGESG
jgi:Flp pilus assembly pilin Flp